MTEAYPKLANFEILSRLGEGGMGRVYLARHRGVFGFEKLLAVKVIQPQRSGLEDVRAMFLDEARLVAQLIHPAIAQVYDCGEADDGSLYLVMEYVPGVSVSQILTSGRKLPPVISASIAAAVCRGLHAAHEAKDVDGASLNVVHRDVTPSNLVVTFGGQVKILDFGIALMQQRTAPVTSVGQIRGKPTYLSPEQLEGEPIDRRTDIYSLSIVLHELLTVKKLFTLDDWLSRSNGTQAPKNWKEIASSVKAPSAITGPLPSGLDEVVMRGLAVAPSERYQDAREMALELEAIVARDGGETFAAFVERELAQEGATHETKLRSLLKGGTSDVPAPSRPATLDDHAPPHEREVPTEPAADLERRRSVVEERREPATVVGPVPARRRAGLGVAIAAVAVAGLGAALFLGRTEPPPPKPAVADRREPKPQPVREEPAFMPTRVVEVPPVSIEPAKPEVDPEPKPDVPRVPRAKKRVKAERRREDAPKERDRSGESQPVPDDGIITEW